MISKTSYAIHDILVNVLVASLIPSILVVLYLCGIVTLATLKLLTFICFVIFVILPLIYKYSYSLQRSAVFLNFINIPPNPDYDHPEKYGLEGARNFYVTTNEDVKLGVWQILPESILDSGNNSQTNDEGFFEDALKDGRNVVIYNHGNGGSRLTSHRVEMYKNLRKHFHVIAYDYRSYGDSSNIEPSEEAVVRDVIFMYEWVTNRTKGHLFVWGHSLGTSLSAHSLALLQPIGLQPTGLILESPFNNMREEISEFPLSRLFRNLPWFKYTIVEPMQKNNFKFETDKYICKVDVPVMILHAIDDHVVPFRLGKKLYDSAEKCRTEEQGKVTFHEFGGRGEKYGHKYMYKAPDFHDKISVFVREAIESKLKKDNLTE